ncbi:peptidase inhibitor family I36 protein [Streptomyces virginiae]|uniref:peptidase inhibitor family I36 protein n=1 Tax=Streptomyces virginiae TaxID=1961 RepID=UPI0038157D69
MLGLISPSPAQAASTPASCPPNMLCTYGDRGFRGGQLNITANNIANIPTPGYSRTIGLFNNRISSVSNRTDRPVCLYSQQNRQGNVMRVGPHENWDQLPFWAEDDAESLSGC